MGQHSATVLVPEILATVGKIFRAAVAAGLLGGTVAANWCAGAVAADLQGGDCDVQATLLGLGPCHLWRSG